MPEIPDIREELPTADVSTASSESISPPREDETLESAEIVHFPETAKEHTPMLDVHPAQHAATTWRDFFVHIATIVLGLLIAIGLEQTVEYIHHRRELADTQEALRRERQSNVARFALEADDLARAVPVFQEDLAVFAFIRAHPGAPLNQWPGKLGGRIITTSYLDSAWRTAQQSNVLQYMPQSEVQSNDRLYRYLQILNDMETAKFDQLNQMRKALVVEPNAAKLSRAELDKDIDRTLDLLVTCIEISNRQNNLNTYFSDFKASGKGLTTRILNWPQDDPGSDRAKAYAKLSERLRSINAADFDQRVPIAQETPASTK